MNQVITVSREFGSGGREIGLHLAKKLGIPFYDKELIYMASDNINMAEDIVSHYDENIPEFGSKGYTPFSPVYEIPMSDQIFFEQSRVIKMLASKGPCVIAGRCADMILEDSINLFIYSKMKKRVERMMKIEKEADREKIEEKIRQVDKKRKEYYQYYTGNTWGRAQNYHLCLDSGRIGTEGCIQTIITYLEAL